MYPSVRNSFLAFTESFEGGATIDYMFQDSYGRVGTAFGIDLDMNAAGRPSNVAISRSEGLPKAHVLHWIVRNTGRLASNADIDADWDTIKAKPTGYRFDWYKQFTKLQLTQESMRNRVFQMLSINETVLKQSLAFRDFDKWPADAQLAVLGLSWNGVGHLVGNTHGSLQNPEAFRKACQAQNFELAASLSTMVSASNNASIFRRSIAQRNLLLNAATVVREESLGYYQRPTLYWPMILV